MGNWVSNDLKEINEENLNLLLEHKIPGLIMPSFIARKTCDIVASRLNSLCFQNYDHLKDIPVHQVGLCHNQWAHDEKSLYFSKKQEAQQSIDIIYEGLNINPVNKVIATLAKNCNRHVQIFEEPEYGQYFAGAFRSFKGHGKLHADHAPSHIRNPWAVTEALKTTHLEYLL